MNLEVSQHTLNGSTESQFLHATETFTTDTKHSSDDLPPLLHIETAPRMREVRETPRFARSTLREDTPSGNSGVPAVKLSSVEIQTLPTSSSSLPKEAGKEEIGLTPPVSLQSRRITGGSHASYATQRTSHTATCAHSDVSDGTARSIFPDEKLVEKGNVYVLYRGILCNAEISRHTERYGFMADNSNVYQERPTSGAGCCSAGFEKSKGKRLPLRVWVDVYRMDLCVASQDSPAIILNRAHHASFVEGDDSNDITSEQRCMRPTEIRMFTKSTEDKETMNLQMFPASAGLSLDEPRSLIPTAPTLSGSKNLEGNIDLTQNSDSPVPLFFDVLQRLRHCFEADWPAVCHIKRNVYQYLWRNRALAMTEIEMMEGQATLAFNLDPKMGIQYLKSKVLVGIKGCAADDSKMNREIGKWLVRMSAANKGGIDPSILGIYFARKDTIDIYLHFLSCLNFCHKEDKNDALSNTGITISSVHEDEGKDVPGTVMSLVPALRYLFCTFKPVGEMQILDRLLKHFAEVYFRLLEDPEKNRFEREKGLLVKKADTLHILCFAAIMINHDLNMAPRMLKKGIEFTPRTAEQFINSVRETNISKDEVEDEYIQLIYDQVKLYEIQMQPLPRVPFNNLPVQPDIEGWLVVILKGRPSQRFWAVVAMQRLYLFSDSDEINAFLCIDLKNVSARSVDKDFLKRAIQKRNGVCSPFISKEVPVDRAFILSSPQHTPLVHDVPPASSQGSQPVLQRVVKTFFGALVPQKLRWVVCIAESKDMSDKWMNSWDQSRLI
eukprot:GEMP01012553.1.p1 GENE.GEMP01012553.1~~GEMP01012553.1.p1  ORF type:complete len:780 (+),score=120.81 GEMP01012553.1:86-2425(+)